MNFKILKHKLVTFYDNPKTILKKIWYLFEPVVSDVIFLKGLFYITTGERLNLKNPCSFNEKLQWLKLYNQRAEYSVMADKVQVKAYVSRIIGPQYLIPTYGVWDKLDDINWDELPEQFVIKSAHDSGGVIICKDKSKLNVAQAKKCLSSAATKDYTRYNKEYVYRDIPHRFIAEKYLEDESGYELKDYKIFCFNGHPYYIQVDFDRFSIHKRNIYDLDWNLLDLQIKFPNDPSRVFAKPKNLDTMLDIARQLSRGIPHLRVDLYNINGTIYFGELTFFHGSGMEEFSPEIWNYRFGELLILPEVVSRNV